MSKSHKRNSYLYLAAKIVFLCLIVGSTLSLFNIQVIDIAAHFIKLYRSIKDMGWHTMTVFFNTILLGAIVIVPISGVFCLLKFISNRIVNTSQKQ